MTKVVWACMLVLGCFLYGCARTESVSESKEDYYTETQNLIFYGTYEIGLEIAPNTSQPSFAWEATGLKYVVITIFKSKIDLKENQISNTKDAVWTWNTGMGRGREGNVSFSDGRDVRDGNIQETVSPLDPGTYYIAAWGYDDNYNLTRSSREIKYEYRPSG